MDGDALTELELLDILSPTEQVKVIIQMAEGNLQNTQSEMSSMFARLTQSNIQLNFTFFFVLLSMNSVDGLIEVFFGDKQYKPTFGTVDENPLQVKFISFASSESSRAIFFYNCIESEESQSEEPEQIHTLLATHLADDADGYCFIYSKFN